jgi:hypothetical protein
MIRRSQVFSHTVAYSAVLAVAVSALDTTQICAQGKGEERLGDTKLEKKYNDKAKLISSLLSGDTQYEPKQHDETLDLGAMHYAYRLSYLENQTKPTIMWRLVDDAERQLKAKRTENNAAAQRKFRELLLKRLREVMPNPKPIAAMNAARILTSMAEQGQEEVADAFVDVLKDPTKFDDATTFCALQGLRALFRLAGQAENPLQFKDKDREARAIAALIGAVERKWPTSSVATSEEVEGQRVWRREAIRALALTRYPAAVDSKGAVKGLTALALLRVVRNDNMNPPPRPEEQFEAAIGVANLKAMPAKDYKLPNAYQPDVAAQHLGQFVAATARRLRTPIGIDGRVPWKTMSARLSDALSNLQADTAKNFKDNKDVVSHVTKIVTESKKVFAAIEIAETPQPLGLANALAAGKLDDSPVFKGDKQSVVKPAAEKPADAPVEKPVDPKKK